MPTLITATGKRSHASQPSGFSLLEILVVVFIVGLLAAVAAPSFVRDNSARDRDDAAESIARLLTLASDYAMFRGQLLAIRLAPDRIEPLRFDLEDYKFKALDETAFAVLELDENLLLEWELDEQQDPSSPALATAIENLQKAEVTEFGEQQEEPPQIYLFPSGESTPVTLQLIHSDVSGETVIRLDTIGRSTLPDLEDGDDAETP